MYNCSLCYQGPGGCGVSAAAPLCEVEVWLGTPMSVMYTTNMAQARPCDGKWGV